MLGLLRDLASRQPFLYIITAHPNVLSKQDPHAADPKQSLKE